jgi:3-oxoacyl-ACP reductase-like protein
MSAQNKKAAASTASKPAPAPAPVAAESGGAATAEPAEPFYQRHPKIANAIFAAVCIYVAMIWLLALDQTFHWGIFGPKVTPLP